MASPSLIQNVEIATKLAYSWPAAAPQLTPIFQTMLDEGKLSATDAPLITQALSPTEELFRQLENSSWSAFIEECSAKGCAELFRPNIAFPPRAKPAVAKAFQYGLSMQTDLILKEHSVGMPIATIQQGRDMHVWQLAVVKASEWSHLNDENEYIVVCHDSEAGVMMRAMRSLTDNQVSSSAFVWCVQGFTPEVISVKQPLLYALLRPFAERKRIRLHYDDDLPISVITTKLQQLLKDQYDGGNYHWLEVLPTFANRINAELPTQKKARTLSLTECQLKVLQSQYDVIVRKPSGQHFISSLGPEYSPLYGGDRKFDITNQYHVDAIAKKHKITLNSRTFPSSTAPMPYHDGVIVSVENAGSCPTATFQKEYVSDPIVSLNSSEYSVENAGSISSNIFDIDERYINVPSKVNLHLAYNNHLSDAIISLSSSEFLALCQELPNIIKLMVLMQDIPSPQPLDPAYVVVCVPYNAYETALFEIQECFNAFQYHCFREIVRQTCEGCREDYPSQLDHPCLWEEDEDREANIPRQRERLLKFLASEEGFQKFSSIFALASPLTLTIKAYALDQAYPKLIHELEHNYERFEAYYSGTKRSNKRTKEAVMTVMHGYKFFG